MMSFVHCLGGCLLYKQQSNDDKNILSFYKEMCYNFNNYVVLSILCVTESRDTVKKVAAATGEAFCRRSFFGMETDSSREEQEK